MFLAAFCYGYSPVLVMLVVKIQQTS